jgi:hypothetical protein
MSSILKALKVSNRVQAVIAAGKLDLQFDRAEVRRKPR